MLVHLHQPPAPLASSIHTVMTVDVPCGFYLLPASLYPTLLLIVRGQIVLHHQHVCSLPRLTVCGATDTPRLAWAAPQTRIVFISVRHGQWPRLFGDSAALLMNMWANWHDLLPARLAGRLDDVVTTLDAPNIMPAALAIDILTTLAQPHQHRLADVVLPEHLLRATRQTVCAYYRLSERQLARRFQAAYGQSLRGHRRQLRSSLSIQYLLQNPQTTHTMADMALACGFYDQAHFNHDIRHFSGQTPSILHHPENHAAAKHWPLRLAAVYGGHLFGSRGF